MSERNIKIGRAEVVGYAHYHLAYVMVGKVTVETAATLAIEGRKD